ncbi:MAG TPA: ATP-binding protein [Dongiaceae bacterium]|jgi:two-component system OmpR family sensor kinase|nr:ATP-binding protein [Dongiaceae bacterium]
MKPRLFWKILFGFWLTFLGIMEALWLAFTLYGSAPRPLQEAEIGARMDLTALAAVMHGAGPGATQDLLQTWPSDRRVLFALAPLGDTAAPGDIPSGDIPSGDIPSGDVVEADGKLQVDARDPAGAAWRLSYDLGPIRARFAPRSPFDWPPELLAAGVAGGLLFSAALAWYLTRPIRRLRRGFRQLAEGALETRLQPAMGRRRDEIADLAADFDHMAAQLQQLVAGRDQLLHDVSHELRSPLARLQVAIDLARQNPQRMMAALDRVDAESRRLDGLVGELLTLARAEARASAPEFDDYFDLADLLRKVADDARFEAEASGVVINIDLGDRPDAEDEPALRGNAELMRRAIENVVRNALRHSKAGQQVDIALRRDSAAGCYTLRIADQGPGVPDQALDTIFEPFVRLAGGNGEKPAPGGFGLGLAIARRAVDAHRGRISAENLKPGGLAVTIRLPFAAPAMPG